MTNDGSKAPDFKLQASDGKEYSLADFAGKKTVVIAWFPKAFTQGCTIECKSLAENGDKASGAEYAKLAIESAPTAGKAAITAMKAVAADVSRMTLELLTPAEAAAFVRALSKIG